MAAEQPSLDLRVVRAVEEDGVFVLGLAERNDGSGAGLIFDSGIDRQTAAPDRDTYSLSIHDADANLSMFYGAIESCELYGGIESCELNERKLRLAFNEDAAREHGLPKAVSFRLTLEASELETLRSGLRRLGLLT